MAVDFSIGARRALEVALRLTPGGEIFVLHAYDVPFQAFLTDPRTKQEVKAEQDQRLSKLVDAEMNAFLEQSGDARRKCRVILAQGTPIDMIFGAIRELRPDLLAMGTHGRTGIARALLGSLAEEILANPPCDVVAVKGGKPDPLMPLRTTGRPAASLTACAGR